MSADSAETAKALGSRPARSAGADDSIDLIELVAELWAQKWLVVGITLVFALAGLAYALLATEIYRAEVVLAPTESEQTPNLSAGLGGLANLAGINLGNSADSAQALATLRSRAFVEDFINDNNLLPVLFADEWDAQNQRWTGDDPEEWPDIRDGVEYFVESVRTVTEEPSDGTITLAVEWSAPELAASWAEQLVGRINERLRARDLADTEQRLDYLNAQLEKTNLVELRQAISRLIQSQIETAMFAQAEEEYAFKVIDPPRIPNEPVFPRKILVIFIAGFLGGVVGTVVAIVRWQLRLRFEAAR